ncbi:MAG: hypothetical protein ACRCYO_12355 [Bacteroidia bacterium]
MRLALVFIILFFSAIKSNAQSFSHTVDSLTRDYLKRLPLNEYANYTKILENRKTYNLAQRIDTTHCQYLYIEESYCLTDTAALLVERYFDTTYKHFYFVNPLDRQQLPAIVVQNGQEIDFRFGYYSTSVTGVIYHNLYENYYTLDPLMQKCKYLKQIQELSFDPTPAFSSRVYVTGESSKLDLTPEKKNEQDQKHADRLRQTYQIVTFIDKLTKKVQLSVQKPAKNPVFNSFFVKIEYQQW